MSLKRFAASTLAVLVLPVAATTVPIGPASAADLRFVASPRKVVVNQAYENIRWEVRGGDSARVDSVDAYLEHVATRENGDMDFTFGRDRSGSFKFYDFGRPGRYKVYGSTYDSDYDEMAVASTFLTIKFGSKSQLRATRSGRNVELTAVTKRYDGGYPLWKGDRGATATYQRYVAGQWRRIGRRTIPSNGVTTLGVNRRTAAKYRVVVNETSRVWGSRSGAVRR